MLTKTHALTFSLTITAASSTNQLIILRWQNYYKTMSLPAIHVKELNLKNRVRNFSNQTVVCIA